MVILSAYKSRDVQQCIHILEQYYNSPISEVKKHLRNELNTRIKKDEDKLKEQRKKKKEFDDYRYCPDCNNILQYKKVKTDKEEDIIEYCSACRYSRLLELP